jgi:hypothetical protein
MSRPSWIRPIRTEEQKIPQFPDTIVIGGFRINTTTTGALETKPVGAPPSQEPADLVQPASLLLSDTAIALEATAEFGGSISLSDLINKLIDIPISIPGLETMPIRSLIHSLFVRAAASEANVADLSGVRIPAVLNEVVNNASLDDAREAAQLLKDSVQDSETALAALTAGTAAADIAAVSARVSVLEAVPPADLSSVEGRLTAAETAIGGKADLTLLDASLALKASQADFLTTYDRVGALETGASGASSRLDAVEGALPGKVSQGDYDVYVAATDAAVVALGGAVATAQAAADAAAGVAAAAEVKGYMSKMIVETTNTAGVNAAYWIDNIGATLMAIMEAGKVAEYIFDGSQTVALVPSEGTITNKVLRLKNGNTTGLLTVTLGGESYEILEKETIVLHYDGGSWKLL